MLLYTSSSPLGIVGKGEGGDKSEQPHQKPRHTSVTHMRRQPGGIGEDHGTRLSYSYAVYG